jgi:hypothetical protein
MLTFERPFEVKIFTFEGEVQMEGALALQRFVLLQRL